MSVEVLMMAARDQLIASKPLGQLGPTKESCEITEPQGRPPPSCGQIFVAVHYGYWRDGGSKGQCLREEFGINITVSMRSREVPFDRLGTDLLHQQKKGLTALTRRIVLAIHMDPHDSTENSVMWRANKMLGVLVNGFDQPLQFLSGGQVLEKGGGWFGAPEKEGLAGFAQTVQLGKAERLTTIEDQITQLENY